MNTGLLVALITIVGTLLLCGVVVWFVLASTKKQAYQGVILSKHEEEREGANDGEYTVYTLIIKTDEGIQKKITIGRKLWETFKVGDRIVKEAGKFNPTKA